MDELLFNERQFTARDIKEIADLSHRQQSDWESKGVIPPSRGDSSEWRKFTFKEAFIISVAARIRKYYGTPLDKLQWLTSHMMEKRSNHFELAFHKFRDLGATVILVTDLKSLVNILAPYEAQSHFHHWFSVEDKITSLVSIRINDTLNALMNKHNPPFSMLEHGSAERFVKSGFDYIQCRNVSERNLLLASRNHKIHRFTVFKKNNEIDRIEAETSFQVKHHSELKKQLEETEFMDVHLTIHEGQITSAKKIYKLKPQYDLDRRRAEINREDKND